LDGICLDGSWKKENSTSRTYFYDNENNEIILNSGSTWIEVVPNNYEVVYQ
jgi:hypothetical protein